MKAKDDLLVIVTYACILILREFSVTVLLIDFLSNSKS